MLARTGTEADVDLIATAAAVVALGGAATILGAWYFQYGLGLAPCPLCLEQRIPYYIAVPLAVFVAIAARRHAPRRALVAGLTAITLVLLWGAGLGVYHAGIEWHWWAGPQDCAVAGSNLVTGGNLLQQMQIARVVRCDEAPWRFLGLSLAGYNALISLALAGVAMAGAAVRPRPAEP
jgi:disulfide bond formation protein DsbB